MRRDKHAEMARVRVLTGRMARSGLYRNWQEIQAALEADGVVYASQACQGALSRRLLDKFCDESGGNDRA